MKLLGIALGILAVQLGIICAPELVARVRAWRAKRQWRANWNRSRAIGMTPRPASNRKELGLSDDPN